jgi:hypothetical protein
MSKSIDLWLDLILPDVPGCPAEFVRAKVREAAVEYCEASHALVTKQAPYLIADRRYSLDVETGLHVYLVRAVTIDGAPVEDYTFSAEDLELAFGEDVHTEAGPIEVTLVLAPSEDATTLPDALWVEHRHAIAAGAKAALQMTPDKPYTSPAAAEVNAARLTRKALEVLRHGERGQSMRPGRTRPGIF